MPISRALSANKHLGCVEEKMRASTVKIRGVRQAASRQPGPGISVPEFGEKAGLSEHQVRLLIREKRIRTITIGSRIRIPRRELENFLADFA